MPPGRKPARQPRIFRRCRRGMRRALIRSSKPTTSRTPACRQSTDPTLADEARPPQNSATKSCRSSRPARSYQVDLSIVVAGDPARISRSSARSTTAPGTQGRCWCETTYMWKASALCHKPLYFEDEAPRALWPLLGAGASIRSSRVPTSSASCRSCRTAWACIRRTSACTPWVTTGRATVLRTCATRSRSAAAVRGSRRA